jgi:hypothetical protein
MARRWRSACARGGLVTHADQHHARAVRPRREWRRIARGALEAVMPAHVAAGVRQGRQRRHRLGLFGRGGSGWRCRSVGRRKGACRPARNLRASLAARRAAASPDQTRDVLKLPNRVHGAVADPDEARQRRGIGAPVAATRQDRTLRRRPVPEWSCRSAPRRGSSERKGRRHEGASASFGQGVERRRGWSKSAQARARPRPRRGFHRFAAQRFKHVGVESRGFLGPEPMTWPSDPRLPLRRPLTPSRLL